MAHCYQDIPGNTDVLSVAVEKEHYFRMPTIFTHVFENIVEVRAQLFLQHWQGHLFSLRTLLFPRHCAVLTRYAVHHICFPALLLAEKVANIGINHVLALIF